MENNSCNTSSFCFFFFFTTVCSFHCVIYRDDNCGALHWMHPNSYSSIMLFYLIFRRCYNAKQKRWNVFHIVYRKWYRNRIYSHFVSILKLENNLPHLNISYKNFKFKTKKPLPFKYIEFKIYFTNNCNSISIKSSDNLIWLNRIENKRKELQKQTFKL